jgi:hypothetical protein
MTGARVLHGPLTEAERREAEDRTKQEERERQENAYKERQIAIAEGQFATNRRIASYTGCLAFITLLTVGISVWNASITKQAANAATDAAKAASETLTHLKLSGAESSQQAKYLISDTRDLATAAATQAGSMKDLAKRALAQANATNALAAQSERSANIAESQRASPWVGIERDSFKLEGPEYNWSGRDAPDIRFQAQFSVKNFGSAPGLHYRARMYTVPLPMSPFLVTIPEWSDEGTPGSQPNDPSHVHACPLTESDIVVEQYRKGGSMILPGESRRDTAASSIAVNVRPMALGPVWTTLCITYFGPGIPPHHSGYGFLSFIEIGGTTNGTWSAKPTIIPDHPGWMSIPLQPAILMQSNAN